MTENIFELILWLLFGGVIFLATLKRTPLLILRKKRFIWASLLLCSYYIVLFIWFFLNLPIAISLFWMQPLFYIAFFVLHWRWKMRVMSVRHFNALRIWILVISVFLNLSCTQDYRTAIIMSLTLILLAEMYRIATSLLEKHQRRYDSLLIKYFKAKHLQNSDATIDSPENKNSMDRAFFQAKKMEALGQLASGIAHDFNNLLASITGYTDLIRKKSADNPKIVGYTETILKASHRAAQMISQLLAFARRGRNQAMAIGMNQSLREVLLLIEHSLDKKISIHTDFSSSEPVILADPEQFQNAVINLVLNARDAMLDGGFLSLITSSVNINASQALTYPFDVKPGSYALIQVKDTGMGMTPEIRERIFEPFFTTKGVGKGTGLGLAGVYGFVKEHNGFIDVVSSLNEGTEFSLYFPLQNIAAQDTEQKFEPPENSPNNKGKGKIMVVDDEDMVRNLICEALETSGYDIISAIHGLDCMEKLSTMTENIDVIILDMIMPGMNGSECFKNIRSILPHQKILLCSGYAANREIQDLIDAGAVGLLRKPFALRDLNQKIDDIIHPQPLIEGLLSNQDKT